MPCIIGEYLELVLYEPILLNLAGFYFNNVLCLNKLL